MTEQYFEMQMKGFASFIGVDSPNKIQANEYYKKFKHLEDTKFHKVIRRLYDTWKYKHFPLLADFIQAKNELFAGNLPEYRPEPRLENVDKITKQKEYKDIIEAMNMLNYLEDRCKSKGMEWIPFIKDMLQKDMVYLIDEKKWTHSSKAVGNVFEPRKYYPPKYYK